MKVRGVVIVCAEWVERSESVVIVGAVPVLLCVG
jgi:hypothetical protein